jgi:hypothetical protein
MFLKTFPPTEGQSLRIYRDALFSAFDADSLDLFLSDNLDVQLDKEIGRSGGGLHAQLQAVLRTIVEDGKLKDLLLLALHEKITNLAFVRALAGPLGLEPLIDLAEQLDRLACPIDLLRKAIETLPRYVRENCPTVAGEGASDWVRTFLWLDDLHSENDPQPIAQCLQQFHALLRLENAVGASHLRDWLAENEIPVLSRPLAEAGGLRGVLIDIEEMATQCTVTAYTFADGNAPPVKVTGRTVPSAAHELRQGVAAVVDECLGHPPISAWLKQNKPFRFEFLLPRSWITLPVDQLMIGGDGNNDATAIGEDYPVVIRPESWCRSKPAAQTVIARRFEERRRAIADGHARVQIRGKDDFAVPGFVADVRKDPTLVALVLPFDASTTRSADPARSILEECLQTHVLAVLWIREAPNGGLTPAEAGEYLRAMLDRLADAPTGLRDVRRSVQEPGRSVRDRLSMIWHYEPVVLPEDPLVTPEVAQPAGNS